MARQIVETGRTFAERDPKINANFQELYENAGGVTENRAFSHTYIAEGDEVATGTLVANTPTKYQLPVTVKELNGFEVAEISPGEYALRYTGADEITFMLNASSSMIASSNNVVVSFMMYKNGVEEPGAMIKRKIGTGLDVGALALSTTFTANTNDYFEVYVSVSTSTTITFINTSIVIEAITAVSTNISERYTVSDQLKKVSDGSFETAVIGTEYYSPDQHGNLYGTIYRQYVENANATNETVLITLPTNAKVKAITGTAEVGTEVWAINSKFNIDYFMAYQSGLNVVSYTNITAYVRGYIDYIK